MSWRNGLSRIDSNRIMVFYPQKEEMGVYPIHYLYSDNVAIRCSGYSRYLSSSLTRLHIVTIYLSINSWYCLFCILYYPMEKCASLTMLQYGNKHESDWMHLRIKSCGNTLVEYFYKPSLRCARFST